MQLSSLVLLFPLLSVALAEEAELIVKTVKEAKSCKRQAKAGDKLQVHYVGRLDDENGKIFDESRPRGSTFNFQLGAGQVSKQAKEQIHLILFIFVTA